MMTTKERFERMYQHREADRIPIIDSPWDGTIRRWQNEGMPKNVHWTDYFDVDKVANIGVDITPQYEKKILEETDKYTVFLDGNHSTVRLDNPRNAGQGKILVIRDSYCNVFGGFLAESYETVVLVDLRYYKNPVSQLLAEEEFDRVLICYSIGNFMTDSNIIWLR